MIETNRLYRNIKYVKPNTIGISIIDGFWTLSVYDISLDTKIVITDDIVGGGNSISIYELKNDELTSLDSNKILFNNFNDLLKNKSKECIDMLDEEVPFFDYDFSNPSYIQISSWSIDTQENNCFVGNKMRLELNKSKRKFETSDITWKEK